MANLVLPAMLLGFSALACAGAPSAEAGPAQAERLYRSKCSACHRAYAPSSRDAAGWAEVLSKMAPRAKLSDAERARILGYLRENARDASPGAAGR
jgi:mono/diheme cytochrome c family protein